MVLTSRDNLVGINIKTNGTSTGNTSSGLSWLTRCAPWSSTILATGCNFSASFFAWHIWAMMSYLTYVRWFSQPRASYCGNLLSKLFSSWIRKTQSSVNLLAGNSFYSMYCVVFRGMSMGRRPLTSLAPARIFYWVWSQREQREMGQKIGRSPHKKWQTIGQSRGSKK